MYYLALSSPQFVVLPYPAFIMGGRLPHQAFHEVQNDKTLLHLLLRLAGDSGTVCWSGRTAQTVQEEFYLLSKVGNVHKLHT
jgi:hypothetical protein